MKKIILSLPFLIFFSYPALAGGVVVSIKPVHSLVAAVMEGDENQPKLLLEGKESLHSFSLKPSQARILADADIVFYISDDFEMFMKRALANAPASQRRVPLEESPGLVKLTARMGGGFEKHDHEHEHHDHDIESGYDLHLWMSPVNAKVMAQQIARTLTAAYPAKQKLYEANVAKLIARLDTLDEDITRRMEKLKDRPFIVFHDAYQYFENRYGLRVMGSITVHPERGLSAGHVAEVREKITHAGAVCVFREPQFDGKVIDNLLAGTNAKSAVLDPEAALLTPGGELYFQLIEGLASGLESCLAAS